MSERPEFRGDYMGFTYNNTHSSTLGIVRTSNGSRFDENLLPTVQDKTVQVPGGDGMYFFGSYYTQRQFSVSFAFDNLTEEQIGEIKRVFGDKQIHDLIFDERPYKVYSAKVTGTATLKYIPFSEGSTNRLYKGEGSLQFTCYFPFARCNFMGKTKEELLTEYPNINEWWSASRIDSGGNFGDRPVPFEVKISGADSKKFIQFGGEKVSWEKMPADKSGTLNTKTGLVIAENGDILNKYIEGNSTLKIPQGATAEETAGLEFTCLYI